MKQYAVGYCRKSTADRQTLSLQSQQREITAFAEREGYRLLRFFHVEETGYSAGDAARYRRQFGAFQRDLFALAEQRQERLTLLVWSTDRLGRIDPDEAAHFRWQCRQRNIDIVFVADSDANLDGVAGSVTRAVKFSAAKEFAEKLGIATKRGKFDHAREGAAKNIGFALGGRDPFGYRRALCDAEGRFVDANGMPTAQPFVLRRKAWNANPLLRSRYVIHEPEASVVRTIFRLKREGLGALRIAQRLNAEGCQPHSASVWSKRAVQNILHNKFYAGTVGFNERSTGKTLGNRSFSNETVTIHDSTLGIISEQEFARVQRLMATQRTATGAPAAGRPSGYLFAKRIVCGACGSFYTGRRYGERPVYVCGGKRYRGNCAAPHTLDGNHLARVFTDLANRHLDGMRTERHLGRLVREINAALGSTAVDLGALNRAIRAQREKLHALFKSLELSAELQKVFETEATRLRVLEDKRDRLRAENAAAGQRVDIAAVRDFLQNARLRQRDLPEILPTLLHSILVRGEDAVLNFYAAPSEVVIDGVRLRQAGQRAEWPLSSKGCARLRRPPPAPAWQSAAL